MVIGKAYLKVIEKEFNHASCQGTYYLKYDKQKVGCYPIDIIFSFNITIK